MNVDITSLLDNCYYEVIKTIKSKKSISIKLSKPIVARIDSWNFGGYGWTSPVNIMMTAAWYKWQNPKQDVCIIWAEKSDKSKISGGFSIRSQDEGYTVPFLTKFRLTESFASPNSGMQGSRALEKLRDNFNRIDRNVNLGQRVLFDIKLFQNIMNDINDSSTENAMYIFMYFVEKSIKIQIQLSQQKAKLQNGTIQNVDNTKELILKAIQELRDPQFVKTITMSITDEIIAFGKMFDGCHLAGIDGSKTAADARANTPGDFWIENEQEHVIAGFEIKDSTKTIGFDVFASIKSRKEGYPSLKYYFLISGAEYAISFSDRDDPQWKRMLSEYEKEGLHIFDFSVREFIDLLEFISLGKHTLLSTISKHLPNIKDLKKDTIKNWNNLIGIT